MIQRHYICIFIWVLSMILPDMSLQAQDEPVSVNRQPAFSGTFYQGNKQALESELKQLFSAASPKILEENVRSLIVPHAGYSYSGPVAAAGFKSIPRDAVYKNIFIIASSHRENFDGASVYSIGSYITPLGEARVNRQIASKLIAENKMIAFNPKAHDREHSIEVQIPLIQYHFKNTPPIVPIVIGSSSVATARDLAAALLPYFTSENLFVISSDFSHYPNYHEAIRIDKSTGDAVLENDPRHFYNVLGKNSREAVANLSTPCCGWSSILTLLYMSERSEQFSMTPVLYRNSGDSPAGDKDRVVGYWAIAGHQPVSVEYDLELLDKEVLLSISRRTLEVYLSTNEIPVIAENDIPEILLQPAGAFVSLYKHGVLRGCIGNFLPDDPLYKVVQAMTVAAATRDTRFYPVDEGELENIAIEISVLTPLRQIKTIEEFTLGRHGLYMRLGGKSGTYLPQVAAQTEWNREEFFGHCARDKAKIGWDGWKEADLFVYEAIVFGESH